MLRGIVGIALSLTLGTAGHSRADVLPDNLISAILATPRVDTVSITGVSERQTGIIRAKNFRLYAGSQLTFVMDHPTTDDDFIAIVAEEIWAEVPKNGKAVATITYRNQVNLNTRDAEQAEHGEDRAWHAGSGDNGGSGQDGRQGYSGGRMPLPRVYLIYDRLRFSETPEHPVMHLAFDGIRGGQGGRGGRGGNGGDAAEGRKGDSTCAYLSCSCTSEPQRGGNGGGGGKGGQGGIGGEPGPGGHVSLVGPPNEYDKLIRISSSVNPGAPGMGGNPGDTGNPGRGGRAGDWGGAPCSHAADGKDGSPPLPPNFGQGPASPVVGVPGTINLIIRNSKDLF